MYCYVNNDISYVKTGPETFLENTVILKKKELLNIYHTSY